MFARPPEVAILTEEAGEDPCVSTVVRALEARGARPVLLATRRFPSELPIVLGPSTFRLGGYDFLRARSVWVRKIDPTFPEEMAPEHRDASRNQSLVALSGFLEALPRFQLDPPEVLSGISTKPSVSAIASRLGLSVPREITTNDPEALREFARSCRGGLICKLVDSGSVSLRRNGENHSFPTTRMTREELEDLSGLEYAPMIFQEEIEKVLELRLTVVGPKVFVASVAPGEVLDWREDPQLVRSFRAYADLPSEVEEKVMALLNRMGLNFATVDLLVTPEGDYVFLEVNSVSYFDHVEKHAGLPISEAVADLLLGKISPRVEHPGREYGP